MSEEKNKLRIHTQFAPKPTPYEEPVTKKKTFRRTWSRTVSARTNEKKPREKLSFSDRLLRNSAFACALLLAVLSLGNINHPWARGISKSVERALTMHIDLDDSIGSLTFVRNLMPESALVFLNLSGESEFVRPSSGEPTHPFSDTQPWLMFSCPVGSEVRAIADGTVTAVSELSGGTLGLLIDHGSGCESVYAYLSEAAIQPGDAVIRGQIIGKSESSLYFELRENETAVDPTARMGL